LFSPASFIIPSLGVVQPTGNLVLANVYSNQSLQEELALIDGLWRSEAFVALSAAANHPPTINARPAPSSTESFTVERKEGFQKRRTKRMIYFLQREPWAAKGLLHLPVARKTQLYPVYPSPSPSGPCNLPRWVTSPPSCRQSYLQAIAVKLPLLVKSHPRPVVMTVASYGFQVVVPLWVAWLVVSQSAHSQKTNSKLNLLSAKENDICNFCCNYF